MSHLFDRIIRWLPGASVPSGVSPPRPNAEPRRVCHVPIEVPRYPPVDPGLPAVAAHGIVGSQADLIARLRTTVCTDEATFTARYLVPIQALARHVHLLPATPDTHFAAPGGLFRLCLEMALFCRQAADARMFTPVACAEDRHALEPRWRYAAFLAGLMSELREPLSRAIVALPDGATWPAHLGSLADWLADQSATRFHVSWSAGTGSASGGAQIAASMAHWVGAEALTWLDGGPVGLSHRLLSVLVSAPSAVVADDPLVRLVNATRVRVLQAESATRRTRYGVLRFGHHLELHLVDAMRHAVDTGIWCAVGTRGPLRQHHGSLYLDWPDAATDIRSLAQANGVCGIPRSPVTLAEVLGHAGFLVEAPEGGWLWPIARDAPTAPSACGMALRLADARSLLPFAQASATEPPVSPGKATPIVNQPPVRLGPDEQRLADHWLRHLTEGRTDLLSLLPGPCLAVSLDLLAEAGHELVRVAAHLDRRGWLGRGDWPGGQARAGVLNFGGQRKPGLVVNADGVRALGLLGAA